MSDHTLTVILVSLLFSSLFSGLEIAFVSANRLQFELDKQNGRIGGKIFARFASNPGRFITSMLLGNNIALVLYSMSMGNLLDVPIAEYTQNGVAILLIQTLISTSIILFTAEFLPKALFRVNPNYVLNLFAIPVAGVYYGLYYVVSFINWISQGILKRLFKADMEHAPTEFGRVDLDNFVREVTDNIEDVKDIENEVQIFKKALDFSEVKARECMVPRNEICALNVDDSLLSLRDKFIETGFSKILIYRESIDYIIGYVHSSELFKRPDGIKNILMPVSIVPESMPADDVLEQLISQKRSMAVVVDEFGGTAGVITMEDVVEEIFGEIEDEHDKQGLTEKKTGHNTYQLAARLEVDYLNEEYKFNIPESEDYETLAGYIISVAERIPEQDETIRTERFDLKILDETDNRIELVELRVKSGD